MTTINGDHMNVFQSCMDNNVSPDDLGGKPWQTFCSGLNGVDLAAFKLKGPNGRISRSEVFSLAAKDNISILTVCAAVLAWGGMRINHRDMLTKNLGWLEVADKIKRGALNRRQAFSEFSRLRTKGLLKGMGPAYFTKLIYFLTPRNGLQGNQAYIMDQWAGCSINLLADQEIVLMDVTRSWKRTDEKPQASFSFRVSDVNSDENYEEFCQTVDDLVVKTGRNCEVIDRAMLADGGKNPSRWREYVIKNRNKWL